MGTKKVYDLAVKVGEYQDQSGATKAKYENVGLVLQKGDGGKFLMLKRTFNPAGVPDFSGKGGENILISMFEPKQQDGQQSTPQRSAPPQSTADLDDDIPF
jgi:hypothetical protein